MPHHEVIKEGSLSYVSSSPSIVASTPCFAASHTLFPP